MKGANLAILAILGIGAYYLSKNGAGTLQSVFDNLSSLLGGNGSGLSTVVGGGTNTPVLNAGTPAGTLDKNAVNAVVAAPTQTYQQSPYNNTNYNTLVSTAPTPAVLANEPGSVNWSDWVLAQGHAV
jgi:hypothetical protein